MKQHKLDSMIMVARTEATARGATPAEIERNVAKYETDEPADCLPRYGFNTRISAAAQARRA